MINKIKLPLSLLILIITCTGTRASFYVDLRLSHLILEDTPEIGDIGAELESDLPGLSPSIAVGYELSKRASLELRYTDLGELDFLKQSPYPTLFLPAPGQPVIFAVSYYSYEQRTSLLSLALPIQVWEKEKFSLRLTPLLQLDHSKVELRFGGLMLPLPNVNTVPVGTVIHRQSDTKLHPGIELDFGCRLTDRARLYLHYTYAPLSHLDAHLIGTGLDLKF